VPSWLKQFVRVNQHSGSPNVTLVGNKVDSAERKIKPKHIMFHRKKNLMYIEVSALSNHNWGEPFLWLCKKLTGTAGLAFLSPPELLEPEVEVDTELMDRYAEELSGSNNIPVLDDDDDF
jgi:GTP-binding nuclear protein Ran